MAYEDLIPQSYKVRILTSNLFGEQNQPPWFKPRIVSSVPEDGVNLSSSSSWDAPLEEGGDSINALAQLAGFDTSNNLKSFSKKIWTGTDPIEVDLTFQFITEQSPFEDVVKPSLSILALPMPLGQQANGDERWVLGPPVTRGENSRSISVEIGIKYEFPFVFPQNADVSFSRTYCKEPDANEAWPVSSEVSFSFVASEIPIREKLGFEFSSNR
jgi:hypothetical protein